MADSFPIHGVSPYPSWFSRGSNEKQKRRPGVWKPEEAQTKQDEPADRISEGRAQERPRDGSDDVGTQVDFEA